MESSPSSLREQGIQALQDGQIDAAIDLLSRAAAADHHDPEAQALLGMACSRNGLHEQARQALETAAALEPRNAGYRYHLGAALEQAGELSHALHAYREALQIDRSHSEAQARAAALEARLAFSPAAAAAFELPPPGAEAPWLAGPYAAAAEKVLCPSCRQWSKPGLSCQGCGAPLNAAAGGGILSSTAEAPGLSSAGPSSADPSSPAQSAMDPTQGVASPGRWPADPAGQWGNRRLLGLMAVYGVAAVCLMGWLLARWLPGFLREAARPKPSPAVQSLLFRAWNAEKSGHPDEAESLFRQALKEARFLGDQPGEALSLSGLGYVTHQRGHPQRAVEFYRQAVPLFRHLRDQRGEADTLGDIGFIYGTTGQPQRALEYDQAALALFRQLVDKGSEANTLNNIGLAYSDLRQPPRALAYLQQALAACREAGDKKLEAQIIDSFGMVYEAAGQPRRALPYYQDTLVRARQIGDQQDVALEIKNIARLQRRLSGHRPAVASAGIAPARAAPLPGGRR